MDIKDILSSWARLIKASRKDKVEAKRRLTICKSCKNYIKSTNTCRNCKCFIAAKVFTRTNLCNNW